MASRIVTRTAVTSIQTSRGLGLKHNIQDFSTLDKQSTNVQSLQTYQNRLPPVWKYCRRTIIKLILIYCLHNIFVSVMAVIKLLSVVTQMVQVEVTHHLTLIQVVLPMQFPFTIPVEHMATDEGLYNMIPFLGRPVSKVYLFQNVVIMVYVEPLC